MNIINKINQQPIVEIVKALGIKYTKQGTTLALWQDGKVTGGWKADTKDGIFSDFSTKGRAEGDRLKFVCSFLGVNRHNGMLWFEETFAIINDFKGGEKKATMNDKWEGLMTLSGKEIDYLLSRNIDYSFLKGVVKSKDGRPTLPIYSDLSHTICALQSRDINGNGRYYLDMPKGGSADGLFYDSLDYTKKSIIVVEGWSDFQSLRQYSTNIVGLLNAGNEHQMNLIKELSMSFNIYFCPDNDESGLKSIEKLKDRSIDYHLFNVSEYGVNDINELLLTFDMGKGILSDINKNSTPPETNITRAIKRAKENFSKARIFIMDKVIDKMCRGFRRGTTILVNGQSTGGKTTFSLYILVNILKNTDFKINYYSLETDIGEQIISIMAFYYGKTEKEIYANIDEYDLSMFDKRLFIYDDIREYHNVTAHITQTKPDIFFIDYVQKLKIEGIYDETQKMVFYAQEMQNFLIDNGHSVGISLSQVAMSNYNAPLIQRTPKNSGALLEASDVVINVGKEDGVFRIGFYKCKGGIGWGKVFDTFYTHDPRTYGIFEDEIDEPLKEDRGNNKGFKGF